MKLWQNAMTSRSLLPFGSKSLPPLPPPMGRPVREFLKICSKPRNLMMPRLTLGCRRRPPLYGPMALENCTRKRVVDLHLPLVIHPRDAEKNLPLRHGQPLKERLAAILLLVALDHRAQGIKHLANGLMKFRLAGIFAHHARIDLVNVRHG